MNVTNCSCDAIAENAQPTLSHKGRGEACSQLLHWEIFSRQNSRLDRRLGQRGQIVNCLAVGVLGDQVDACRHLLGSRGQGPWPAPPAGVATRPLTIRDLLMSPSGSRPFTIRDTISAASQMATVSFQPSNDALTKAFTCAALELTDEELGANRAPRSAPLPTRGGKASCRPAAQYASSAATRLPAFGSPPFVPLAGAPGSFRLDAGLVRDAAPERHFLGDALAQLVRRARHGLDGLRRQQRASVRVYDELGTSRLSRATIGLGVPAGMTTANTSDTSYPGRPASTMVCTSGTIFEASRGRHREGAGACLRE